MIRISSLPDEAHTHLLERRFSLEELSQKWNKPVPELQECIRRCQFRRVVCDLHHFYLDPAVWPFEEKEGDIHLFFKDLSAMAYFRLVPAMYLRSGFSIPQCEDVWIPEGEVLRIEHLNKKPRLPGSLLSDDGHPYPRERRYALDQLSERWNISVSDLRERIRLCEFRRVVCLQKDKTTIHYYLDPGAWPFEEKEETHFCYNSGPKAEHFVLRKATGLRAGFMLPSSQEVWIPEEEVKRFEELNNLRPYLQEDPLEAQPWAWIEAPELKIAVEAYYRPYKKGELRRHQKHPEQIEEWLKKHYPNLSQNALDRITTVVNEHKGGSLKGKYS